MQNVIAKRLRTARQAAGLTQRQLSDRLGFKDRQTLASIESGARKLSADELLLAMKVLGRDLEYFTDPFRLDGEGSFSWRTSAEKVDQLGDFESRAGRWLALYRFLAPKDQAWPAPLRISLTPKSLYEDAHRAAAWLVNEWKLGNVPAETLEKAVRERLRALVLYVDAPEGISGAAFKLPDLSAILINRNEPAGRRSYDLAHEVFHLLTWETIPPAHSESEELPESKTRREQLANCFASALLMPEPTLRATWRTVCVDDNRLTSLLDDISRKFRVTVPALRWRLVQLELLQKDVAVEPEARRTMHETPENKPRRFSLDFARTLHQGIQDGRLSVRRAASVLGLSIDDLADLFREYSIGVPFDL